MGLQGQWPALLGVVLLCTGARPQARVLLCEQPHCTCDWPGGDEYFCQVDGKKVNVIVKADSYYSVDCFGAPVAYEHLPRLAHAPRHLAKVELRRGCGLPRGSLGAALLALGVASLHKLVLEEVTGEGDALRAHHLQGLGALSTLSLAGNGLSALPDALFAPLANLTWLDLNRNRVRLAERSLAELPRLRTLELNDNALEGVPSGAFAGLAQLRVLRLRNNALALLPANMLANNSHLEELDLSGNPLLALPRDLLSSAALLQNVTVSGGRFDALPEGLFEGAQGMRRVVLWDNAAWAEAPRRLLAGLPRLEAVSVVRAALASLPADLLAGSDALRNLTVSATALTTLPEGLLHGQRLLESLDLSDNRLGALPPALFASLGALKVLVLKNNAIKFISGSAFMGLSSVERIDASGNGMREMAPDALAATRRLLELDLSRNELAAAWAAPRSLRTLLLSRNRLREVPDAWRRTAGRLRRIDLSHNRLGSLQYLDFSLVRAVDDAEVDLRTNNISAIVLDEAQYREEINASSYGPAVRVLLDGNPLRCDCGLYWFVRTAREREGRVRSALVALDGVQCAAPDALRGRALSQAELPLGSLRCDLPERDGCPAGCACAVRPHDRALLVQCSGRAAGVPRLPELGFERVVLHLERCNVTRLRPGELPANVAELYLDGNRLEDVDPGALPAALTVLQLRGNRLSALSAASAAELLSAPHRQLWLAGNPLRCDCEAAPFLAAVQQHYARVADYELLRCPDNSSVSLVTTGALCSPDAAVAAGSALAALGLLLGLAAALFYKYKREAKVWLYARGVCLRCVTEDELDRDKRYDAFVSFSHLDEAFVVGELVPALEAGPRPYRVCVHFRDWVPGEAIPAQIAASVEASRRTVVVLSRHYLSSAWGRVEFRVASAEAGRGRTPRLVVVLLGDIGPLDALEPEVRAYLSTNTYIKWGDPWFWDKLRYALPHRRRPRAPSDASDRSVSRRSHFDDRLELSEPPTPPVLGNGCAKPVLEPNGTTPTIPDRVIPSQK